MQILIYGFQRSGTTLLRRIVQSHPDVKKIFHEHLLLRSTDFTTKKLRKDLSEFKINIKKDNWGEKVPYYKSTKKFSPAKYCKKWLRTFRDNGKVIHIIRHPYDTANSVVEKYDYIDSIKEPLEIYQKIVPAVLESLEKYDRVLNIKYEDLLLNPKKNIEKIFEFCGLDSSIDYRYYLRKISNEKYQTLDPSRVFAYKKKSEKTKIDMGEIFDILNKIPGTVYEK